MSSQNPFDFLDEIENRLGSQKKNANIIFDMLTSNGNNNRFGSIYFDGGKFIKDSYENIDLPQKSELRIMLNNFYVNSFNDLKLSTVTESLKFLIKNKYVDKF